LQRFAAGACWAALTREMSLNTQRSQMAIRMLD
jgi:hypothetical protein